MDYCPEVVQKFGDLKKPECHWHRPALLERYEPSVKTVFKRNPEYFLAGQPYVDGWRARPRETNRPGWPCRTGQIDCGPYHWWAVRQADLESLQQEPSFT